ncbi:pPIWI_RE module domain-containing protein [Streptomyces halobius]|uniref:DUF3962 domain-containing protein n=1 Tax=Streptomyces halobius TaxID=2879846 RepID=A0ABY4MNX4_9ACTN|nr:DUF3962 domain-containing protein [Streptomyces halobius]UQA98155.1 DUF3962 domain-containing protein [Streptomyces halobius]
MPHSYEPLDDELTSPAVAVTTHPITPKILATAVREWERRVRKGDDANTLAPLLAEAEVQHARLSSFVRGSTDGRPHAPGWFHRVAAWNFAQRLSRKPLPIPNGPTNRKVRWRMDTQGSLISWDRVTKRTTYWAFSHGSCCEVSFGHDGFLSSCTIGTPWCSPRHQPGCPIALHLALEVRLV